VRTTFQTLQSSCVCIEDRVDPAKQLGVHPPKLKGKGDYAGDLRKVPCYYVDEEHIAADQIFPVIKTELYYTPTIKHHCPRTAVASSLRACSNKVGFDPKVYRRYKQWFISEFIPDFLKCLSQEIWEVDLEKWLLKYPEAYRANMRKAIDKDHQTTLGGLKSEYEAFTKVEMQYTTVPHDLKDTPLNDTKERQICGPCDEKKVYGNPFINLLEEVASKYFKPYCGRSNWEEICASLEEIESEIPWAIWGASDGSGFDMTQYPEMNELMNMLLEKCARHPNVHWIEPLTVERFLEALCKSLILKVSVDYGQLKYEAVGRASGDGWTTFGNTMLMISYWMFTFKLGGISKFGLKVKGDDVLFAARPEDLKALKEAVKVVFTNRKDQHNHGLGQICKKIDFGEITDLDFLSNEFFRTKEGRLRMTRIPARVIQTLSWTTKLPRGSKHEMDFRKQLCFSKGKCLEAWADGLPIFGALAKKMIELGEQGRLTEYNQYADEGRVWAKGRQDYDAYLVYLEQRYGLTSAQVRAVEEKIARVNTLDGELCLPELECFYAAPAC